jgi:type I restriction enzyme S subunit
MKPSWSKIWISDICKPKQWKTIPLQKLTKEGYPVYGANGKIGFFKDYNHEKPTILITCRGATCGQLNICEPFSYVTGNAMALDDLDKERIDLKFLFYALQYRQLKDVISGSAQPQITKQGLEAVSLNVPGKKEQKRIAAILDKADAIRRKRKKAIQLADKFLRSVFLDMFGDPVTNPKEWPLGTIRDLVSEVKYGTSKKAHESNGEYPILRMNNITYHGELDLKNLKYIDLENKEKDKYLAKKGDLLFNRTNSKELVGKTAVYNQDKPMAIAGYLIRVRSNDKSNPHYISAYLNSKHGKATLLGMCKNIIGMANINAQELQDIKILIPPMELQNKYAKVVESVNKKKETLCIGLDESILLSKSLTQRAFRGEL